MGVVLLNQIQWVLKERVIDVAFSLNIHVIIQFASMCSLFLPFDALSCKMYYTQRAQLRSLPPPIPCNSELLLSGHISGDIAFNKNRGQNMERHQKTTTKIGISKETQAKTLKTPVNKGPGFLFNVFLFKKDNMFGQGFEQCIFGRGQNHKYSVQYYPA